jgi:hypothetical protein
MWSQAAALPASKHPADQPPVCNDSFTACVDCGRGRASSDALSTSSDSIENGLLSAFGKPSSSSMRLRRFLHFAYPATVKSCSPATFGNAFGITFGSPSDHLRERLRDHLPITFANTSTITS